MQATTEASKAAIIAVREAGNPVNSAKPVHTKPRSDCPALRQPTFDWKAADKY